MPTKAELYKKTNIDMKSVAKVYEEVLRKRRDLLLGFWIFTSIMLIVTVLAGVWLFTLFPLFIFAPSLVCAIVLGFLIDGWRYDFSTLYMMKIRRRKATQSRTATSNQSI